MRKALLALALMLAFTAPGSAQTLPNPSFEKGAAGRPAGWNTQT